MPKILTIEDSAFERNAIINVLSKAGYKDIIEAATAGEGLKRYGEEKPDLVLLDLRMPDVEIGIDTLKKLIKLRAQAKIIVVSIVRDKETIDECIKLGAKAYINKPVTEGKLIPEVKKVLG